MNKKKKDTNHKSFCSDSKRGLRGSYTVEAALVFSMTFFVLAALLFAVFYVHDRAVIQAVTCEAAAAGTNHYTVKERQAAAGKVKGILKAERLLGSRNLSVEVSAGKNETEASCSASYPVPGLAAGYFNGNRLQIRTGWKGKVTEAADIIRKIRGAGALLTGGDQ